MDGMSAILTLMGRATIKTKGLMTGWMNDCREERERDYAAPNTEDFLSRASFTS